VSLIALVFPEQSRRPPCGRWWNIAARTVHLAATGTLLGGHVFGVPADRLWPYLWVAIATGVVLTAIELYPTGHWLHQGCAVAVYLKLAVLCLIPWWWDARVVLLIVVLAIASVGAHAPRTLRHYSLRFRRVMAD
jgi:hypothetical protein